MALEIATAVQTPFPLPDMSSPNKSLENLSFIVSSSTVLSPEQVEQFSISFISIEINRCHTQKKKENTNLNPPDRNPHAQGLSYQVWETLSPTKQGREFPGSYFPLWWALKNTKSPSLFDCKRKNLYSTPNKGWFWWVNDQFDPSKKAKIDNPDENSRQKSKNCPFWVFLSKEWDFLLKSAYKWGENVSQKIRIRSKEKEIMA